MIPYKILSIGTKRNVIPFVSYETYLQIWSWSGGGENQDIESHHGGSSDETLLKWSVESPPEGNCGRAYVNRQVRAAGRKRSQEDWDDEEELTDHQKSVTQQVNSVLSAPIRRPDSDDPVAVFNLDTACPIEETNLTDDKVKRYVAEEYAEPIGRLL